MIVHGYGSVYTDNNTLTLDTVKFWNIFNLDTKEKVSCVPEFLGCDYVPNKNITPLKLKFM